MSCKNYSVQFMKARISMFSHLTLVENTEVIKALIATPCPIICSPLLIFWLLLSGRQTESKEKLKTPDSTRVRVHTF